MRSGRTVTRTPTGVTHDRGVHRERLLHRQLLGPLLLITLGLGCGGRVNGGGARASATLVALGVQVHCPPVALSRLFIGHFHKSVMK